MKCPVYAKHMEYMENEVRKKGCKSMEHDPLSPEMT